MNTNIEHVLLFWESGGEEETPGTEYNMYSHNKTSYTFKHAGLSDAFGSVNAYRTTESFLMLCQIIF